MTKTDLTPPTAPLELILTGFFALVFGMPLVVGVIAIIFIIVGYSLGFAFDVFLFIRELII